MKKKRLRNYELIREKDRDIPAGSEPVRRIIKTEKDGINFDTFRKSKEEKLRLKRAKKRHKKDLVFD